MKISKIRDHANIANPKLIFSSEVLHTNVKSELLNSSSCIRVTVLNVDAA